MEGGIDLRQQPVGGWHLSCCRMQLFETGLSRECGAVLNGLSAASPARGDGARIFIIVGSTLQQQINRRTSASLLILIKACSFSADNILGCGVSFCWHQKNRGLRYPAPYLWIAMTRELVLGIIYARNDV